MTQVSSTQMQPLAQQATVMTTVNQSTAASPSLGQSLPQQPQNSSPSLAIDESTKPNWLIEDAHRSVVANNRSEDGTSTRLGGGTRNGQPGGGGTGARPDAGGRGTRRYTGPHVTSRWTIPRRIFLTRHLHESA